MSMRMKHSELKFLMNKGLVFNQFMMEEGGLPEALIPAYLESNKHIEKAFADRNATILKALSDDIDVQICRYMPIAMVAQLKEVFKKNSLEFDLTNFLAKQKKAVEKIVKNGEITTPEEYELLLNFVDEEYQNPDHNDIIVQINTLLSSYDKCNI